jgi:hypothetical protein
MNQTPKKLKNGVHPTGGWDERRAHDDGYSFWRLGERHRADGFAVYRDGSPEAWLFGRQLITPEHRSGEPLFFIGQSRAGKLNWVDDTGAIRAVTFENTVTGITETRWYDREGDPEPHWVGGYHVARLLENGERRYYKQPTPETKPLLHRLDGPAIEHATVQVKSVWCVDGNKVQGPLELLIRHTVRAQKAAETGTQIQRLILMQDEKTRLRMAVIKNVDGELATDIAIAFPDEYHAAMVYLDTLDQL